MNHLADDTRERRETVQWDCHPRRRTIIIPAGRHRRWVVKVRVNDAYCMHRTRDI